MKKARKTFLIFNIILMISAIVGTQFVSTVSAKPPETTYNSTYHYTCQHGSLGGANYEILMPDNWNGHLVIMCRGYTAIEPPISDPKMQAVGMWLMKSSASQKFAYAWSTYGEGGFCVEAGIIRTHQLTQYVVDNYEAPGKVLLMGFSMGGQVALRLAAKYPDQYDGVLDICGCKDMAALYAYYKEASLLPLDENQIRSYLIGAPVYMPADVASMISPLTLLAIPPSFATMMSDLEMECGATPETKLQAYDRRSPISNAQITVPVISLIARYDMAAPLQQFMDYYDAVAQTGCLTNYRSYTINAAHCDNTIFGKVPIYFPLLYAWVLGLSVPPVTPRPAA
jgi:hypothetical protein